MSGIFLPKTARRAWERSGEGLRDRRLAGVSNRSGKLHFRSVASEGTMRILFWLALPGASK